MTNNEGNSMSFMDAIWNGDFDQSDRWYDGEDDFDVIAERAVDDEDEPDEEWDESLDEYLDRESGD